jgi:hypothetical protein
MYRHVSTRTWFTLFFIPVLPYDNSHFLVCPICSNGRQLTKAQAQHAIAMAQHTNLASSGVGYGDAYEQQVNAFWASLNGEAAPPPLVSPAAVTPPTPPPQPPPLEVPPPPPQEWGQPPAPPYSN